MYIDKRKVLLCQNGIPVSTLFSISTRNPFLFPLLHQRLYTKQMVKG